MTLHPRAEHLALQQRRDFQQTAQFKQQYDARAGIEGTISQTVRVTDLRHARYIGFAKTRLQHILCATALNLCRITDYIAERLRAPTLPQPLTPARSAFVALATAS